jgi:isochorismate hydrolase
VMTSSQEDHIQGPLMPELKDILSEAFEKRVKREGIVNAWADANFKAAVEATGRKNLIMACVTIDVCLVFPAINAVTDGYNVQAVMDTVHDLGSSFVRQAIYLYDVPLSAGDASTC